MTAFGPLAGDFQSHASLVGWIWKLLPPAAFTHCSIKLDLRLVQGNQFKGATLFAAVGCLALVAHQRRPEGLNHDVCRTENDHSVMARRVYRMCQPTNELPSFLSRGFEVPPDSFRLPHRPLTQSSGES
jgi:hypothetical protein